MSDCGSDIHKSQDEGQCIVTPTQYPEKLMSKQCSFVPSSRLGGKPRLQDEDGYLYTPKYCNKNGNSSYYVCKDAWRFFCKTRAVYIKQDGGFIKSLSQPHTHPPNKQETLAALTERAVIDSFIDNADSQPARPNEILSKVLRNLEKSGDPGVMLHVSRKEALRGKFRRGLDKKKITCPERLPKTWKAMKKQGFPERLTKLSNGCQFLRYRYHYLIF